MTPLDESNWSKQVKDQREIIESQATIEKLIEMEKHASIMQP